MPIFPSLLFCLLLCWLDAQQHISLLHDCTISTYNRDNAPRGFSSNFVKHFHGFDERNYLSHMHDIAD